MHNAPDKIGPSELSAQNGQPPSSVPAPANPRTISSTETLMTTNHSLTPRERLTLAGAALRGVFAGIAHALLDWALNNFTS